MLLGPGEGEVIRDTPERTTRLLVDSPQLAAVHFRYGPGLRGPDLHIHHHHADCFYVIDGALTFELAGGPVHAGAGTFVLVPPYVVHTFRNDGPAEATFLNLHAPGMGFGAYLRGEVDFDQHEPPGDGGEEAGHAHVVPPGHGELLALGPARGAVLCGAGEGIGSLAVVETTAEPGFPGPPAHRHRAMLDSFFVLDGTLSLLVGETMHDAPAGAWASVEPGTRHTFLNTGQAPVRLLNLMAPAGLEAYLRAAARLAAERERPPEPAEMGALAARHDFEPA